MAHATGYGAAVGNMSCVANFASRRSARSFSLSLLTVPLFVSLQAGWLCPLAALLEAHWMLDVSSPVP